MDKDPGTHQIATERGIKRGTSNMSELRPLDCTIALVAEPLSQPLYCLQDHLSEEAYITVAFSAGGSMSL